MANRVDLREEISINGQMRLYDLLVENAKAKASEPRDKIFALLSLAAGSDEKQVQANYDKTLAEVSKELTQDLIKEERSLVPLRFGSFERSEELPSWCPDWSQTHDKWERRLFHHLDCSLQLDPEVEFHQNLNILKARGFGIAKMMHCAKIDGGKLPKLKSDEEILAECVNHRVCPSDPGSEHYRKCTSMTYLEALTKVCHLGGKNESFQEGIMTWRSVRDVTSGPLFLFQTYDGFLGRAFDEIKEDDLVCILKGGRAPCILRMERKIEQITHWVLISQAYVEGLMNGEIFGMAGQGHWQWFEIC